MSNVLIVSAFQLGDPVILVVPMEACDSSTYASGRLGREPSVFCSTKSWLGLGRSHADEPSQSGTIGLAELTKSLTVTPAKAFSVAS